MSKQWANTQRKQHTYKNEEKNKAILTKLNTAMGKLTFT